MQVLKRLKAELAFLAAVAVTVGAFVWFVPRVVHELDRTSVVHAASPNYFGAQVSCGTSATNIGTTAGFAVGAKLARGFSAQIDSASANTVFFGKSTVTNVPANAFARVTAANAHTYYFPLGAGQTIDPTELYCASTTGATTIYVLGFE